MPLGGVRGLGDPEVDELDAVVGPQQVARLDVAVPHPEVVDVPQSAGGVDRETQHVRRAHPSATDHLGNVLAFDELEDKVRVFVR